MWFKNRFLLLILTTWCGVASSQSRFINSRHIDREVQYINALTPDSLSHKLTAPYKTELEKVRAIYGWITQNISYNTGIIRPVRSTKINENLPDTAFWGSGDEMTAQQVLRRRVAVCEGYAKLFKTLCFHAGIASEVITGYARGFPGRLRFRTNHSWNAVRIDSSWYLVDATWGSGFLDQYDRFVQRTDESYFLTRPERFLQDHFPDDLRWTLLSDIPALPEFRHSPYKTKFFVKYSFGSMSESRGMLHAKAGDTVRIEIELKDRNRDEMISPDPFFDSTIIESSPSSVFMEPVIQKNKAVYSYIVLPGIDWLHLRYNEDIILRYRIKIRKSGNDEDRGPEVSIQ